MKQENFSTLAELAIVSGIAMWDGVRSAGREIFQHWQDNVGQGGLELYQCVGEYAQISAQLYLACVEFENPGIYPYEVDEEFGHHLAQLILNGEEACMDMEELKPALIAKLKELATAFYASGEHGAETAAAIAGVAV